LEPALFVLSGSSRKPSRSPEISGQTLIGAVTRLTPAPMRGEALARSIL